MKQDVQRVIKELSESFLNAFRACLYSDIGINTKVGRNTLRGSNLDNESNSRYIDKNGDTVVELLVNDYIQYVENGRRSHKMPPIEPIIQWAKRKGISTDNNTMWKIRKSIADKGIRPRPIMQTVWEDMDAQMQQIYLDRIFDTIIKELNIYFND